MNWFEVLTGFREESPEQVRANLSAEGGLLTSRANGRTWQCGWLETPSLAELRGRVRSSGHRAGAISIREIVGDIREIHRDRSNAGALFQVASQFNLLEMPHPSVTPERGVGGYEHDHTQGPACAIAAGAGTIYRNYFAPVKGQIGQTAENQIDCLADLGSALGNSSGRLWEMRNGYALAARSGLMEIAERLGAMTGAERDELRSLLRIGLQWRTQVTVAGGKHAVSQAYCSALPVAYGGLPTQVWEEFARLVLEATYEATFCAAALNSAKYDDNRLFLTLVGGGVFGNEPDWIFAAVERALDHYSQADLDVAIVSYGSSNASVRRLIARRGTHARAP